MSMRLPPSAASLVILLPALLSAACSEPWGEATWALQHASAGIDTDGVLSGYQTWEIYSKRWQRKQKSRFHLCALVESIEGQPEETFTCPDCVAGFLVTTEVVETDCPSDWLAALGDAPGAEVEYLVGAVPETVAELDLEPARSLGWYLRWADETEPTPQGFVWPEDEQAEDAATILAQGGRLTFWPAYAWELGVGVEE